MNYKKIYDSIIERSLHRSEPAEYCEYHHIVPMCMGGEDEDVNKTILTAREHFLVHWLLVKTYPHDGKIVCAFNRLTSGNYNNGVRYFSSSYKYARENFSTYMKKTCNVIDKNSKIFRAYRDDIRIKSGELIKYTKKGIATKQITVTRDGKFKKILKEHAAQFLIEGWQPHTSINFILANKGKVYVNNSIVRKLIKEELLQEYLDNGWKLGRMFCSTKNTIWITNNIENKMIKENDVQYFLDRGWRRGCTKSNKETKVHMHNNIKDTRVPKSKIDEFLKDGYFLGRLAKPCKNRTWISNDENNRKAVKKEELDTYLHSGWKLGYFKK